jgi:hypothetical protein
MGICGVAGIVRGKRRPLGDVNPLHVCRFRRGAVSFGPLVATAARISQAPRFGPALRAADQQAGLTSALT